MASLGSFLQPLARHGSIYKASRLSRPLTVHPSVTLGARRFISSSSSPLDLAYEKAAAESIATNTNPPIVILHGLFGQKQNWRSLGKAIARSMNTDVYTVDLRNHGTSPHHPDMSFKTMASDVRHFFRTHELEDVALIGHSLGGRVASALALDPNLPTHTISSLTVVDITPLKFRLNSSFPHYLRAMQAIDAANVPDQKSAVKILRDDFGIEQDIQHFLLTNLGGPQIVKGEDGKEVKARKFKIPLPMFEEALGGIGNFPFKAGESTYEGPTMLIRGSKSDYVPLDKVEEIRKLFPKMQLETLDAGHWVHSEKPKEFMDLVNKFVQDHNP